MKLSPDSGKILSLIVPSYNMERYLPQCLDSLIMPGFEDVEVLVVNDGSKDRTLEIARDYERRYPGSVRVIDKLNGNYGSCINTALPLATGKYIRTLDADDSFCSTNLPEYLQMLKRVDADIIITDYVYVDEAGNTTKTICYDQIEPNTIHRFEDVAMRMVERITMHSVTYRRAIFTPLDYHQTEGISYTDHEWMFLPYSSAKTLYRHPAIIYRYLVGRAGQTMEDATFIRRTPDNIKSLTNEITIWNNAQTDSFQSEYLFRYLTIRLHRLYDLLLQNPQREALKSLAIFDTEVVAKFPELYQYLSEYILFPALGFHPITEWRRQGRPSNWRIPFSIHLRRALNRIKITLLRK